jgi:hypothetical protein
MIQLSIKQNKLVTFLRQNPEYKKLTSEYLAASLADNFNEFEKIGLRLYQMEEEARIAIEAADSLGEINEQKP